MNKSHILFLTAVIALLTVFPQQSSLGDFAEQSDIGNPIHTGRATYDSDKQEYTIEAAGTNMWASRDEFHFVWRRLTGNFILTTNTAFVGKGVEPHRKMGWMVRASLDADSPHTVAVVHGDGLTSLQFRRSKGAATEEIRSKVSGADVLQLERKGNSYTVSVAKFGDVFTSDEVSLDLGDEVYV
ncbi:MAG TPA: hypothetical protein VFX63_02095, partial [Pyrinomonadaceae bacterium]|nr:hypothetical protein [Pyrinomonadaceae bacterium]